MTSSKDFSTRRYLPSSTRTARPTWALTFLFALGCANVTVGDEGDDEGMGGEGMTMDPSSGGGSSTTSGGSGGTGGTVVVVTGGSASGGAATGGDATGGDATGGGLVGDGDGDTGGSSTGGDATGGAATGGTATGGAATGGAATGGAATGGAATGGAATGGAATGGAATGGGSMGGDCDSPDLGAYGSATACGQTVVYNGSLYECITMYNQPGDCNQTAGVWRCNEYAPDNPTWGDDAWQLIQSCP